MARPIGLWLASVGRDLRFAAGQRTPPFSLRAPREHAQAPLPTRRLVVGAVVRETPDAVTLWLSDPTGAPLLFVAGQFFTVLVGVGGGGGGGGGGRRREVLRRAYSASSSPRDTSQVALTVKRITGGRASTHLVENARAGDTFEVLGPSGSFTLAAASADAAAPPLVLVAGGSGVTPLVSILREVLETEPGRHVALLHANRTAKDAIFREALASLAAAHAGRFTLTELFGATLDGVGFAAALDALPSAGDGAAEHYVCGPEAMMHLVREVLAARGVPAARVHEERFVSPQARVARPAESRGAAHVTVRLSGRDRAVLVPAGSTLLEAGIAADVPMPFSCGLGGCGACRVKVCAGRVEMDEPTCLTDEERALGYALACVGTPSDGAVVEVA